MAGRGDPDPDEMKIQHAYGVARGFALGQDEFNRPPLVRTVAIARALGDHDYEMRGLWSLFTWELNDGRGLRNALDFARQFSAAANGDDADSELLIGERMEGCALHLLGRHAEARATLEAVLQGYADPERRSHTVRFQFSQVALAQAMLAWTLCLQGDSDGASAVAEAAVAEAARIGHANSLGHVLDAAGSIAIVQGDLAAAARVSERLGELGTSLGVGLWTARNEVLRGMIQVKSGDLTAGLRQFRAAFPRSAWTMTTYRTPFLLSQLAEAEAAAGALDKALLIMDDALGWFGHADEFWCAPECLRIKGELLARSSDAARRREGEALIRRGIDLARRHGAAGWERRAINSLETASL